MLLCWEQRKKKLSESFFLQKQCNSETLVEEFSWGDIRKLHLKQQSVVHITIENARAFLLRIYQRLLDEKRNSSRATYMYTYIYAS